MAWAWKSPPKESVAPALKKLAAHGTTVEVLTGDNEPVTPHGCGQVGLPTDAVPLGAQVEALRDEALKAAAEAHSIFAKLTPLHRERTVRAPHAGGHVMGFMGDGIKDAAALRAADIMFHPALRLAIACQSPTHRQPIANPPPTHRQPTANP